MPATGVLAGVGLGLLQAQAEPERRGRGHVDRPLPLPDLFGQPRQLGGSPVMRPSGVRRAWSHWSCRLGNRPGPFPGGFAAVRTR